MRRRSSLGARVRQAGHIVTSIMLAHCLTAGIPLGNTQDYGVMPVSSDWVQQLYAWQTGYVSKLKTDLVKLDLWDRLWSG